MFGQQAKQHCILTIDYKVQFMQVDGNDGIILAYNFQVEIFR